MDKNFTENEKIEKEISELKLKISELKRGYETTIHEFAKGQFNF